MMRFGKILGALGLMVSLLVLPAPQVAHAAPGALPAGTGINADGSTFALAALSYSCPSGYMCLYTGTSGGGTVYPIAQSWTGCRQLPSAYDNTTSSIYNNTSYTFRVFVLRTTTCTIPGQDYSNVGAHTTGNMSAFWDDTISAYQRA